MTPEAQTVLLALFIAGCEALVLCALVRTTRSEPPPPEGKVTSSPVIRPHHVRPSGAPMDWREL